MFTRAIFLSRMFFVHNPLGYYNQAHELYCNHAKGNAKPFFSVNLPMA